MKAVTLNNASTFPKPSTIANAERGVITLKASSLGRQNIGSIVEFECADGKGLGGTETHVGQLATIFRGAEGTVTIRFAGGDPDEDSLELDPAIKVLVSQDSTAVRGFAIADRGNRVGGEILNVLQMLSRDITTTLQANTFNVTNHHPALVAV